MEKAKVKLGQLLTLIGPAQKIVIINDKDSSEMYQGISIKARNEEEFTDREVKHIQIPLGEVKAGMNFMKIWVY